MPEARERLRAILSIVRAYLPPDSGISAEEALSGIIAVVDPWPIPGDDPDKE